MESLIAEFSRTHPYKRGDLLSEENVVVLKLRCLATDPKFILLDEPLPVSIQ
jgi:ABC-type lipopolysaccharide export system ATPase subunit